MSVSIGDQKRASYPLGLELEMVASLHVGCWRSKPGPLVGQSKLLLLEPSLQLSFVFFAVVFVLFLWWLLNIRGKHSPSAQRVPYSLRV